MRSQIVTLPPREFFHRISFCLQNAMCARRDPTIGNDKRNMNRNFFPKQRTIWTGGIPRVVHQSYIDAASLTPAMYAAARRTEAVARLSGWAYKFYSDQDCRRYIERHQPSMLEVYDGLIPKAFKADVFRYCVLFVEGGLWLDITDCPSPRIRRMSQLVPAGAHFVSAIEAHGICACHAEPGPPTPHCYPAVFQAVLASAPGSATLAAAMEMISAGWRARALPRGGGFRHLGVTGPVLLGRAVRRVPPPQAVWHRFRDEYDHVVDATSGLALLDMGPSASTPLPYEQQYVDGQVYR